jgi:uncharacterized membrane protein YoaK (UPF0700 family)
MSALVLQERPGTTHRWIGLAIVSGAAVSGAVLGTVLMNDLTLPALALMLPLGLLVGWSNIASP